MNGAGKSGHDPLRVGLIKLASCSGCQLSLLAGGSALVLRLQWIELARCPLLSSAPVSPAGCFDLVLVEGAVESAADVELLQSMRKKTPFLVAVGACASGGGVLRGQGLRAVPEVVTVDAIIPGCPPSRSELVTLCGAVARGGLPAPLTGVVCLECRAQSIPCLLEAGQPCLGPVTRAGCQAACPGRRIPCEGCRGWAEEANPEEMRRLLQDCGIASALIEGRLCQFREGAHDQSL
jgi:coenzyme F420-reducing hydrogenase gamma subunit